MFEKKEEKKVKKKLQDDKIMPKKDWVISHNDHHIVLKKGESCNVPDMFLHSLKSENVI